MAIAFDASASGSGSDTATWSHTTSGSDRILLVGLRTQSSDSVTGVTYNSVAMTFVNKTSISGDGGSYQYLYILVAPATGANNVVASASGDTLSGFSLSYTGAAQTGQPDANSAATNNSNPLTTSATATVDGTWAVSKVRSPDLSLPDSGTNYLNRFATGSNTMGDSNGSTGTAGSKTVSLTFGASQNWAICMALIAPAVAAGPTNVKTFDGVTQSTGIKTYMGVTLANTKTVDGIT